MTIPSRRCLASLVLAGLLAACSSDADPQAATMPAGPLAADTQSYDATYQAAAVVLEPPMLAAKLKNREATDGVYRFDASAADDLAKITPGTAVLLSGVDIVKVDSVANENGEIVLHTTPASLPDVVQDGQAKWDVGMQFAPVPVAATANVGAGGLRLMAVPGPSSKLSFKGKAGMFDVEGNLDPQADHLKFSSLVGYKDGTATFKVAIDGKLKQFRHAGNVSIHNGKVDAFYIAIDDLDLELDMNLGGVALGKGDESFSFPVEIVVPETIGPVPTYISIGAKLSVNPSLSETSSSLGKAHFVIKGSLGMSWSEAGGFVTSGSLGNSDVQYVDYDGVSTVDCGFGLLAEFPIVKFGVGLSVAGGAVSFKTKSEVVTNMTMRYEAAGNFPVITGNCFEANLNLGSYIGGEVRLAGLKMSKDLPIWTKVTPLVKKGDACK